MVGCNNKKGFTIVEMLIASVVFSIIFGVAVGILVSSIKLQKYNLSHNELLSQTSYTSEYMARFLRMAVKSTGACIPSGFNYQILDSGRRIRFINYDLKCQDFFWDTTTNQIKINSPLLLDVPLTSTDFQISNLLFSVLGDNGADGRQPRVSFYLEMRGVKLPQNPSVKIGTTISQRNIDK